METVNSDWQRYINQTTISLVTALLLAKNGQANL